MFLDPLHARPDSVNRCPGILSSAQAGAVTLADAVGNGIADNTLLRTYAPGLIRYCLGESHVVAGRGRGYGDVTRQRSRPEGRGRRR
ncbi:circularly permuted type 2 ATP-grasp protein [Streptomyces aureus]|uniref:circularly permuted type 2 ATP-grasp protein n=1 Tax=Streptomyces aureus TaxID=193461 RepID=UPI0033D89BDA